MLLYDCGVFLAFVDLLNIEIEYVLMLMAKQTKIFLNIPNFRISCCFVCINCLISWQVEGNILNYLF